ncbi:hypothetical protein FisN_4Lh252 [Fistulifera solaris]|uniref:HSF-type DNA-binding domain-containing protein n=1 Tax=Fistulifera solaris TaxID=1519565 RepID=A0A1Z5KD67_FISSO|nr:hypothetical protein FisN_4Lh252 [Fistulifera solaris]|eukprot:GAX24167.1 hypothetical protein FisN_4Lh252 [Fistulifera solaris]
MEADTPQIQNIDGSDVVKNGNLNIGDDSLEFRHAAHEYQDRNGQHHPIAEFLYQLTKMLTDDNNEVIEWSDGRIRVHYPERLEAEVLHKYFRHSKFASFQRQLNYFGFRKIAGKGKMSPCSYVNDAATSDIRSLLLIKRKTNGSAARKAAMQQRASDMIGAFNPALAGMNLQALAAATGQNLGGLNGQALTNAMALLQENAFRAGLGQLQFGQNNPHAQLSLLALQQQQQQLQELQNQQLRAAVNQSASNSMPAPAPVPENSQNQQSQFTNASGSNSSFGKTAASIEQLQAQLAALAGQNGGNNNGNNSFQNFMQLKQSNQTTGDSGFSSATAALQAQSNSSNPATAAMDAAASSNQTSTNMFDSAANLQSLLNSHPGFQGSNDNNNNSGRGGMSSHLLNRLPSSTAIFPENSTLSFGGLLGSSNRLSSLLSLNSFGGGSREASLADLAAASSMGQFSAPAHLQRQS